MSTKHNSFTRVLCTILSIAMMISVIPLTVAHAEDDPTGTVRFGTYNSKAVLWDIVKSTDDGILLIAKNAFIKSAATKFNTATTAFPDYGTSALATYITGTLLTATFTEAQQAKLVAFTTTYTVNNSGTAETKTYEGKMAIPSAADIPDSFLTKTTMIGATAATNYWTADGSCTNASDKKVACISTAGTKMTQAQNATTVAIRPVICIAAADLLALDVEGASFTDADGNAINYVVRGEGFKLTLDDAYNQSTVTVKAGETALTADDNSVYTVPADAASLAIEGVEANPADFTAYDEALAAAKAIDASVYDEATFAPVKELLDNELDKDTLTGADQAQIDQYVADLNAAVANLPADFRAYDEALAKITEIKTKGDAGDTYDLTPSFIFDADYTQELTEGLPKTLKLHIATALNKYKEATIHTYKIGQQADVDKATAAYNLLISKVGYLSANITNWKTEKEFIEGLDAGKYTDVEEAQAACAAIVAEHDYEADPVDVTHQAEVDAAAAQLKEIAEPFRNGEKYIGTDFSALDAAIAAAAEINLDDYITTEEYEADGIDEKTGKPVNEFFYGEDGAIADQIKEEFAAALEAAQNVDREANAIKYQSQDTIDDITEKLEQNMARLAPLKRLTKSEKTRMKIKAFFQKIANFFKMVSEISKTLWGLLGMLFRGEIDLYSVFEMIGVDQKFLDFLIKIGIKPMEPEEPEEPEEPAPGGLALA